MILRPPLSPLFPYTTLFRSRGPELSRGRCRSKNTSSSKVVAALAKAAGAVVGQVVVEQAGRGCRWEEHTSELESRGHLVCSLLREKGHEMTNLRWDDAGLAR